jgi:glycosyltransferase involved in cell wall biosynthesis
MPEAKGVRILIVSDAGPPQVNGVVMTLTQTAAWLTNFGHEVSLLTPATFRSIACPTYPEIRFALWGYAGVKKMMLSFEPHHIHVATEGPLGFAARRYCIRHRLSFTTSYHTQFAHYVRARAPIPLSVSFLALRWFHGAGERCMVSTATVRKELSARGFSNLVHWGRGVDTLQFRPQHKAWLRIPRPIAVYVGRVAVEKNVEEFLRMPWTGSKVVIGDGPARAALSAAYPETQFLGYLFGAALANHLAAADVFVFPSRTDTFGLVMLEAMACGVPVAAFPVTGPLDVVADGVTGALDENLAQAAKRALRIDPGACRQRALASSWELSTRQFEQNLVVVGQKGRASGWELGTLPDKAHRHELLARSRGDL